MRMYWDLNDAERTALTEDEVAHYCELELLEKGVPKPATPMRLPDSPPPCPTRPMFCVVREGVHSWERRSMTGLAFETQEQYDAFLKLNPRYVTMDSRIDLYVDAPFAVGFDAKEVGIPEEVVKMRADRERYIANQEANQAAAEAFDAAVKKANEATSGIWSNWRELQEEKQRLAHAYEEWRRMLDLCENNVTIAKRFFLKQYDKTVLEKLGLA